MAKGTAQQASGVEQKLIGLSRQADQDIFRQFGTGGNGLNPVEAGERLEEYGRNIIDAGNENSLFSPDVYQWLKSKLLCV